MNDTVKVALGNRTYDVVIENGLLDRAGAALAPFSRGRKLIIVTDANVAASQLPRLVATLAHESIIADVIVLPAGEATKSWQQLSDLTDALLTRGVERSDHIVALGGGVIGDLVGFAASILKRGCNFIQIPTTLLAQVDSSVGGKTAINSVAGKNMIGAFHQPALVLIDPTVLNTLPLRDIRAGYAEVVKYGLINDPAFFDWCEANGAALLAGDADARRYAIRHSVAAKAAIVADDERETSGRRALLNLGHTFGHALEAATGFSNALLHGEGVAAGLAIAFRFSAARGLCHQSDANRVEAHLAAIGLPTHARSVTNANGRALADLMANDKKGSGGAVPFLLARGIGQTYLDKSVTLAEVAAFLDLD
jgi:3-dehydroquinate synthase